MQTGASSKCTLVDTGNSRGNHNTLQAAAETERMCSNILNGAGKSDTSQAITVIKRSFTNGSYTFFKRYGDQICTIFKGFLFDVPYRARNRNCFQHSTVSERMNTDGFQAIGKNNTSQADAAIKCKSFECFHTNRQFNAYQAAGSGKCTRTNGHNAARNRNAAQIIAPAKHFVSNGCDPILNDHSPDLRTIRFKGEICKACIICHGTGAGNGQRTGSVIKDPSGIFTAAAADGIRKHGLLLDLFQFLHRLRFL